MSKKDKTKGVMISFRLSDDEAERLTVCVKEIQKINPHLSISDAYRELMGLVNTGIVSRDMRKRLSQPGSHRQRDPLDRDFVQGLDDSDSAIEEEIGTSDSYEIRRRK